MCSTGFRHINTFSTAIDLYYYKNAERKIGGTILKSKCMNI